MFSLHVIPQFIQIRKVFGNINFIITIFMFPYQPAVISTSYYIRSTGNLQPIKLGMKKHINQSPYIIHVLLCRRSSSILLKQFQKCYFIHCVQTLGYSKSCHLTPYFWSTWCPFISWVYIQWHILHMCRWYNTWLNGGPWRFVFIIIIYLTSYEKSAYISIFIF